MMAGRARIFRSVPQLRSFIAARRANRVVLANGCFDPLHVGHVRYLEAAKGHGDFLVVAVNDDRSTRRLKGDGRPLIPVSDRVRLLSSLKMIDAVLVFSARDVRRILENLRPAVHAKGTDYTPSTVPELDVSRHLGIETVIAGDPKRHDSTDVIERLRAVGREGR